MSWTTPKNDWTPADVVIDTDMNRIEGNTLENYNNFFGAQTSFLQGFEINANNGIGSYVFSVGPGRCVSKSGDGVIYNSSTITKLLSTTKWAPGNSSSSPCKVDAVTFLTDRWYYVFIIKNPTSGAVDVVIDDNVNGTKYLTSEVYTTFGYTLYRRVAALKASTLQSTPGFVTTHGVNGKFQLGNDLAPRQSSVLLGSGLTTGVALNDTNAIGLTPFGIKTVTRSEYSISAGLCYVWDVGLGTIGNAAQIGPEVSSSQYQEILWQTSGGGDINAFAPTGGTLSVTIWCYLDLFDDI